MALACGARTAGEDRLDPDRSRPAHAGSAGRAVAVAEQIAGLLPPRRRRQPLTPHPRHRRMCGHVEMHDAAARVRDEEEDVQRLEAARLHGEAVRSPELRAVVGEEASPGLGRRTPQRPPPVAPHRLRAHRVAERERHEEGEPSASVHPAPPAPRLGRERTCAPARSGAANRRSAVPERPGPLCAIARVAPTTPPAALPEHSSSCRRQSRTKAG